jgi:hypothetical protein
MWSDQSRGAGRETNRCRQGSPHDQGNTDHAQDGSSSRDPRSLPLGSQRPPLKCATCSRVKALLLFPRQAGADGQSEGGSKTAGETAVFIPGMVVPAGGWPPLFFLLLVLLTPLLILAGRLARRHACA